MLPILRRLMEGFRNAPIADAEAALEAARQVLWVRRFAGGSVKDVAFALDASAEAASIAATVAREAGRSAEAAEELLHDLRLTLYVSAYGDPAIHGPASYPAAWIAEARRYAVQPHPVRPDGQSPASR